MIRDKGRNSWSAFKIMGEYVDTVDKMEELKENKLPSVTVFGSARLNENTDEYKLCYGIVNKFTSLGYNVITGGGPGIMEAANKASKEHILRTTESHLIPSNCITKPKSVGIGIELPFESGNNEYIDKGFSVELKYFFIRKVMLMNYSDLYLVFKGGFGTLDELFEVLTLMQTGKIDKKPIYLVGSEYWGGLIDWIKNEMLLNSNTISEKDLDLIKIINTFDDINL